MRVSVICLLLLLTVLPAYAEEDPKASESYTAAELAALDRALHAANLSREDLTFRKDLAKGHACLDVVRKMLRDPLTIAPEMDAIARVSARIDGQLHPPLGALAAAHDRYDDRTADLAHPSTNDPESGAPWRKLTQAAPKADALMAHLERMAAVGGQRLELRVVGKEGESAPVAFDTESYRVLRRFLPDAMAWREVFASPYTDEVDAKLKARLDEEGDAYLHELAARIDAAGHVGLWLETFGDPVAWLSALPEAAFPEDEPLVKETPYGRIALGTPGDDVYQGEYTILIDPGGNDRYEECRLGTAYGTPNRRVGFFADLGGNDVYACGAVNLTLGAAVLGVAAFFDLGAGDDRYEAGHGSLGASFGGCATFYDDGGSDTYLGRTFTQGAAGFGVAVFQDDAVQPPPVTSADEGTKEPVTIGLFDNDRLTAWSNAQAFARCRGIALCINTRGNDTYEAGGVYLHAPLFADRYQSYSQGFAIGERGIDYAGGIAMVIDRDGNDRYLGDIYNQGVGYWYAAGFVHDGGGNDLYEMTQYGQGSGIHLAVGGLVDVDGHDTYVMHSGLGQGGSHDYAASILHDRGGNDRYMGSTSCNGCGLTNSVGLFFDREGNDTYAGRKGSINHGRPARGYASVGVLVDLEGEDHYLGIMEDASSWRHTDIGVGIDVASPEQERGGVPVTPAADQVKGEVEIPAICSYEGELTQAVFDELWAIAIRWEVGENRRIVPVARTRLVAFGAPLLPYLDRAMDKGASGLELRAYVDVLGGLREAGADAEVVDLVRRNLTEPTERRRRLGVYLTGELRIEALAKDIAARLIDDEEAVQRRAAGVLTKLGSDAGNEILKAWLADPKAELRVLAALGTLLGLGSDCYSDVRPLLDHPLVSVRSRLAVLLASKEAVYGASVVEDLVAEGMSPRAVRTLLDVLARMKSLPETRTLATAMVLVAHEDWGVRADAARVLRRALDHEEMDDATKGGLELFFAKRLEGELEPYVRFWLQGATR
ncbi:MAG: hypothetical protein QNJ98_07185 [Planctomycetota bacterium]|nr:hypothetical protein [Planctomycetota bacterium]